MRTRKYAIVVAVLAIGMGVLLGVFEAFAQDAKPPATSPGGQANVDRLLEELSHVIPGGWEMLHPRSGKVQPTHWPAGSGVEITMQRKGFKPLDWKMGKGGEVIIWIMAEDYQVDKPLHGLHGETQVGPAEEVFLWHGQRVFVFGGADDWPQWKADITKVLKGDSGRLVPSVNLRVIRVAVFDFDVLKGVDLEPAALTDQINAMLAEMPGVTIVNRDQIKKVADEHKMVLAGLVDNASAAQLGKFLSANYVIVGRASRIGQTNYLVLKIVDVATTVQT
ncbi:MAG TPA: hypothetical protein VNA25_01250, partial [Phycisphaerae bacterium]|nr:hypothetical protein [Phycisphaerae bacterium]